MLQIDQDQLATLRAQRERRFEERLCAHGRAQFPQRCGALPEDTLRKAARRIIGDARALGIASELGISLYFNVAVCFGMNFLQNRDIAWAFPLERHPEEAVDPGWIVRVSEIAVATLRRHGR